jgi:hypothetical protein
MRSGTSYKFLSLVPTMLGGGFVLVMILFDPRMSTSFVAVCFNVLWSSFPYIAMSIIAYVTQKPYIVLLAMILPFVLDVHIWLGGHPIFPRSFLAYAPICFMLFSFIWALLFGIFSGISYVYRKRKA